MSKSHLQKMQEWLSRKCKKHRQLRCAPCHPGLSKTPTKPKKTHIYVEHASWCRDGIIFKHTTQTGNHFHCVRCQGEKCPTCFPHAYADKRKPYVNAPAPEPEPESWVDGVT